MTLPVRCTKSACAATLEPREEVLCADRLGHEEPEHRGPSRAVAGADGTAPGGRTGGEEDS